MNCHRQFMGPAKIEFILFLFYNTINSEKWLWRLDRGKDRSWTSLMTPGAAELSK
jgi:hypothetical protein